MTIRNALLSAAIFAAIAEPATAAQNLTKRATVLPDATIEVSNVQGSIGITAWDRNEVELVAVLESDKDELAFEATDRHVRIEVDRPHGKNYGNSDEEDATLTLRVPKGARLIIDTVSADITIIGVRGEQSLESVSGEVQTQAFDAPVSLSSVSGEVMVAGNDGKAAVSTENVSGSTTVSGIRGSYDGEVVSGNISATVAAAERLNVNTVSGDIEVRADLTPTARVSMESISGTITMTVKPPVNADFDIESFSGDIENCFGQKARDTSKYTPGSELDFTQGSGGARVEIQTLSGEISICDH
jgi:DUF4097 and DUF4098 domain-containing protein YvlB